MHIEHKNLKEGSLRLGVDNLDDLWYLSQIVETGDQVTSKSLRKVERGGEGEKKQVSRIPIVLTIKVEKIEWSKNSPNLRILGIITAGPEDAPRGEHHSFSIEVNSSLTIRKEHWPNYQLERVDQAITGEQSKVMLILFDREEALFVLLKKYGYDILTSFTGNISKKETNHQSNNDFYEDIKKQITHYDTRYKLTCIILASPAFFKEDLLKELTDAAIRKKIVMATVHSVGRNGVAEALKRPEVKTALLTERASNEQMLVDELLSAIAREGSVAYGIKEVLKAGETRAIAHLLITDTLLMRMREEGKSSTIETLMKETDAARGKITIVSTAHEGGNKLDGLGGIGAILRYKLR